MKSAKVFFCIAAAAMLASCTPPTQYAESKPGLPAQPPVQRERQAYLRQTSNLPVTCTNAADCNEKWTRALTWVTQHSTYTIKTHTDSLIETAGPIEPTTDAAFKVTRTAVDANTSSIHFSSTCGEDARCSPTTLESASSFNNFVLYGN